MTDDLFVGIAVRDYPAALAWYERFFGSPPAFIASPTEAVWELGEHRYFYINERPERAGRAIHTVFVDDFDSRSAAMAERGVVPAKRETYANGVRKLIYRDPEGNEIGLGGAPVD